MRLEGLKPSVSELSDAEIEDLIMTIRRELTEHHAQKSAKPARKPSTRKKSMTPTAIAELLQSNPELAAKFLARLKKEPE